MKTNSRNTLPGLLLSAFIVILLGSGCYSQSGHKWISGEGPIIERKVNLAAINGFALSNSADVILTQGNKQEVKLSGQENILENMELTVEGSVLSIKNKENVRKSEPVKIYITIPSIEVMKISGSGDVETTNRFTNLNDLNIKISGSGDIKADVDAKNIIAVVSGSGDICFTGNADALDFKVSGSGDLKAKELKVRDAEISITGSGDATINVSGTLKGSVAGSGDISYTGDPKVDFHHSGSGGIHKVQ
ncbi:MAG: DUF2807 domain-containing protein [Bacteroidales bacterium]|nr:DUF2807 domain-containing protein [Bacteroidales bacterium]